MKKLFPALRSRLYLFLFFAAQSGSSIFIVIFLSLVVLANAAAVLK